MKKILAAAVMVLSLGLVGSAFAGGLSSGPQGQTKAILNVTAQVINVCEVTTTPVNFGIIDGTEAPTVKLNAVGSINVSCTAGQGAVNISLDKGSNSMLSVNGAGALGLTGTTGIIRNVANGMDRIAYELYQPDGTGVATTTLWGDSDFANTYPDGASYPITPTGFTQSIPVYGTLFLDAYAAADPAAAVNGGIPAGIYTDVVNVTVDFQ